MNLTSLLSAVDFTLATSAGWITDTDMVHCIL